MRPHWSSVAHLSVSSLFPPNSSLNASRHLGVSGRPRRGAGISAVGDGTGVVAALGAGWGVDVGASVGTAGVAGAGTFGFSLQATPSKTIAPRRHIKTSSLNTRID